MNRCVRLALFASIAGLALFAVVSCSKPASTPQSKPAAVAVSFQAVPNEPGVQQAKLPEAPQPTVETATITFLTGDVEVNDASSWLPANIGDALQPSEQIKVGSDSYCEVQFGNLAVARLQANTLVAISKLQLGQARQVGIALTTGAVLSKVEKLAENDQYRVATQTAVAGVRGTEFSVAVTKDDKTELAVRQGVVTVVPPQAIITPSAPAQEAAAKQVEASIVASAPTVKANEQLVVSAQDFAPMRQELAQIKQRIDSGATAEAVKPLVATAAAAAEKTVPKPAPMTQAQQKTLAVTASMNLLPPAPATPPSTTAVQPAPPRTVPLSVSVVPSQAVVSIDGQAIGPGGFTGLYRPGQKLTVSVTLQGYQTKVLPVTIPDSGTALKIELTQIPATQPAASQPAAAAAPAKPIQLAVRAVPESAQILIDGKPVGAGSYQGDYPPGRQLRVRVEAPGYNPETRSITLSKTESLVFYLTRKIEYGTIQVTTNPSNAAITFNGQYVGTGSYSAQVQADTQVQVSASLRGYSGAEATIQSAANATTSRVLTLQPRPIEARLEVAGTPLVRSMAVWNGNLISVDKKGTLRSTAANGTLNWEVATANSPNDNSQPIVSGNTVYLSGAREFVGVDAGSGAVRFRIALDQSTANLFGRSVEVANGEIYYPADNQVLVYAEGTGKVAKTIRLPSSSNMSALVSGGRLFIVDQQGTLYVLDAQSGRVVTKVGSGAFQPVAVMPLLIGNQLFFAGRKGTAVLVDLSSGKVAWQKELDPSQSVGVFTDPVAGAKGIYLFGKNTLYALSTTDGRDLFAPIANVSAPPLIDGGSIYYGTSDGRLVRANALTGATEASVALGGVDTTRPVFVNGDVAVGTSGGEILLVYPGTMPR